MALFMKRFISIFFVSSSMFMMTGCQTMIGGLWEQTKTMMRYVSNKGKSLFQGDSESRLVASKQEFYGGFTADFIPLNDSDAHIQSIDYVIPQPKEVPGDPGGTIPGISSFHSPTSKESSIFKKIYFDTDKDRPKGTEHYQSLKKLAHYLKKHPSTYIFIEGHCDERASEAYNQALGTRRSNFIRNYLIKNGVNPEQLYTISYGKERPEALGHSEKAWSQNRRAAFKIYEKRVSL